jgi:hypothetical protein
MMEAITGLGLRAWVSECAGSFRVGDKTTTEFSAALEHAASLRRYLKKNCVVPWQRPAKYGSKIVDVAKSLLDKRAQAIKRHQRSSQLMAELYHIDKTAFNLLPRTKGAVAVLMSILYLSARDRCQCDASINTIMDGSGCSRRLVHSSLNVLSSLGLIEVQSGKTKGMSNIITIINKGLMALQVLRRKNMIDRQSAKLEATASDLKTVPLKSTLFPFPKGVQNNAEKRDHIIINNSSSSKEVSFPTTGSIAYDTHWSNLAKIHGYKDGYGGIACLDLIASSFRAMLVRKRTTFNHRNIEKMFIGFVRVYKPHA